MPHEGGVSFCPKPHERLAKRDHHRYTPNTPDHRQPVKPYEQQKNTLSCFGVNPIPDPRPNRFGHDSHKTGNGQAYEVVIPVNRDGGKPQKRGYHDVVEERQYRAPDLMQEDRLGIHEYSMAQCA